MTGTTDAVRGGWLPYAVAAGPEAIARKVQDECALAAGLEPAGPSQQLLVLEPPGGWAQPSLIGAVHAYAIARSAQRSLGAFFTPIGVARRVVDAIGIDEGGFVVDPSCGTGAFLVAALDHLVAHGTPAQEAVAMVAGIEIDPTAAHAARATLRAWQLLHGIALPRPAHIVVGDCLGPWPRSWPTVTSIVGNPPFASPLRSQAVPEDAVEYRNAHAEVLGPYADLAAIHLWRAIDALPDGGRLAMILPISVVNARDTARMWQRIESVADVESVILIDRGTFEADVETFAPIVEVHRRTRAAFRTLASAMGDALGLPDVPDLEQRPTLASVATATSGFRDEFYGLADVVVESSEEPPGEHVVRLLNVGSIDPLVSTWGRRPIRFAKERWERPVADRRALEGRVLEFVERQCRPKVLLATQTSILEPLVDPVGDCVGITPTIAVFGADPYRIAAVLLAPPVVAIAARRWYGTGLTGTALRPTAGTVLDLPLPLHDEPWSRAAALIAEHTHPVDGEQVQPERGVLMEIATAMTDAYGADRALVDWWVERGGI